MHHSIRILLAVVCFSILYLVAEGSETPASYMAQGARHFLGALTSADRQRSTFDMQAEERLNWHYIPRERKGVPFGEMTPPQRKLGHALLASGLSRRGYIQATEIMFLEQILREKEGGAAHRDADAYFFSVFGDVTPSGTWGWRVEGHHLSLNFTIREGKVISSTPLFFGANPGRVLQGGSAHMEPLAQEEALARRLVQLFEGGQEVAGDYRHRSSHRHLDQRFAQGQHGRSRGGAHVGDEPTATGGPDGICSTSMPIESGRSWPSKSSKK